MPYVMERKQKFERREDLSRVFMSTLTCELIARHAGDREIIV